MIKKLGTALAALALTATSLQAASAATASANFTVKATVSPYAAISFNLMQYTFTAPDNSALALPANENGTSSNVINATLRTSAGTGSGSLLFTAPATIPGSASDSIPISALSYSTTGNYTTNVAAGTTATIPVNVSPTVMSTSNTIVSTFGAGTSVASSAIYLNLFLNDQFIPADTYNSANFVITVSAT
jgi:hypothetical protein